ncbi:hypothetical protein [Streptosporangium minutum]|uniref:hypothetical protein n=1 Tax=Streptosporangium minutum TaxID=569862 RepID=UPI001F6179B6|nr:hypothetical protein [Streptosporangium minutum]
MAVGRDRPEEAAALVSVRAIPSETPGVAIVASQDGQWYRARSFYVSEATAEYAAHHHAHLAPSWAEVMAPRIGDTVRDLHAA